MGCVPAMQVFRGRYYNLNRQFLSVIGQWPFRSKTWNKITTMVIICLAGTQFIAKVFGLISVLDDVHLVLESLGPMMIDVCSGIKLFNSMINADKIKEILRNIKENCSMIIRHQEVNDLRRYSEVGRKITVLYSGFLFFGTVCFILLPIVPQLLDRELNETERQLIHNVKYFVDEQEYYYPIMLHSYVMVVICITIVVAMDSLFVVMVQHACCLFSILGKRIENISTEFDLNFELYPSTSEDMSFRRSKDCIVLHNRAIEFANLIEATFSTSYFLQSGLNMLVVSVTAVQAAMNLNNSHEFVRQVSLQACILLHLYFECSQGQQLMNHSSDLHEALIHVKWYQTSMRTRKLVSVMIMRVKNLSVLTAGKVFNISMETFSTIVRTSVSYFTLLQSMQ